MVHSLVLTKQKEGNTPAGDIFVVEKKYEKIAKDILLSIEIVRCLSHQGYRKTWILDEVAELTIIISSFCVFWGGKLRLCEEKHINPLTCRLAK